MKVLNYQQFLRKLSRESTSVNARTKCVLEKCSFVFLKKSTIVFQVDPEKIIFK